MPADLTLKQGDTEPSYADQLTYSNGEAVNLEKATVTLTMRSLLAPRPVTLTGAVTITKATSGEVAFTFSEADTANPGTYMANWLVVFPDGARMTFPTTGYLWFEIGESLATAGGAQLVGLGELKDHLFIAPDNRSHDDWLLGEIEAVRPLIEEVVGPIIPQTYDERYDGGNNIISLLHAPTYGWATNPLLNVLGVSEFRGPIEYPLSLVPNPVFGSIYSVEVNPQLGELTRRTAGGGVIEFMPGRNSVHVVYEAGQSTVPPNVRRGAVEAIRWWYETTQPVGKGSLTRADEEGVGKPMVGLPHSVREMLQPSRRHPSIG